MRRLLLGLVIVFVSTTIHGLPRSDLRPPPDMWLPGVFPSGVKPLDSQTAIRAMCFEEIRKPPVMRDLSHPPGTLDMDDELQVPEVLNLAVSGGFEEKFTNKDDEKKHMCKSHRANKKHSRKPILLCGASVCNVHPLLSTQPVYRVYKVAPVVIYLTRLTRFIHTPLTVVAEQKDVQDQPHLKDQLRGTGVQINYQHPSAEQHHSTAQPVPIGQGSRTDFSSPLNPSETLNQSPPAILPQTGTNSLPPPAPSGIIPPQSGVPSQPGLNIPPQPTNVPQTGAGFQPPSLVTSTPESAMLPKPALPPAAPSSNPIQPVAPLPAQPVAPMLPQQGRVPSPQSVLAPGIGPVLLPQPLNPAHSIPMSPQPAPVLPQPPLPAPALPQPPQPAPALPQPPLPSPVLPQPPLPAPALPQPPQPAPALPQLSLTTPTDGIAMGQNAVPPPRPVIPVNTQ
ncbi:unnamed protein product [Calicophoron daubneyi]|uniref:Uncharacterized protein n=1 Tax=Calicophoron daubneyi TaxID=300641 RepID=A0AAV2T1T3_CALDB